MARKQNRVVLKSYPGKLYFFVCEDEKSMCCYLEGMKPYLKSNLVLRARHSNNGNTAKQVYQSAKWEYDKINKNKEAYVNGFKVIACFDKDENDIADIKAIMNSEKKYLVSIYNNPCYEFWLYLHMKNNKPNFSSSEECAKKCLDEINAKYKKHFRNVDDLKREKNIFEIVKNDLSQAIKNAKTCDFKDYNTTYTNAHKIIEEIIDLRKLKS